MLYTTTMGDRMPSELFRELSEVKDSNNYFAVVALRLKCEKNHEAFMKVAGKYLDLLTRFVEAHAQDMGKLGASLTRGDQATALRLAHTLRGTAATLGADQLAAMAGRLEEGLKDTCTLEAIQAEIEAITIEFAALSLALPPRP